MREEEDRGPGVDEALRVEPQHGLEVAVLEDELADAERRPGREDVHHDRGRRDEWSAQQPEQEQEADHEHDSVDERRPRAQGAFEVVILRGAAADDGAGRQLARARGRSFATARSSRAPPAESPTGAPRRRTSARGPTEAIPGSARKAASTLGQLGLWSDDLQPGEEPRSVRLADELVALPRARVLGDDEDRRHRGSQAEGRRREQGEDGGRTRPVQKRPAPHPLSPARVAVAAAAQAPRAEARDRQPVDARAELGQQRREAASAKRRARSTPRARSRAGRSGTSGSGRGRPP